MKKRYYTVQPYKVSKSLAIIIPSDIVKMYKIDPSTGFILSSEDKGISLQFINTKKKVISH